MKIVPQTFHRRKIVKVSVKVYSPVRGERMFQRTLGVDAPRGGALLVFSK